MKYFFLLLLLKLTSISVIGQVLPNARQLQWQAMETNLFVHFTVNTYTGKEWGDGTESPQIFNPVDFDAHQWTKAAKEAGFKMIILTAKHHDGFCLWQSKYTTHSVKSSPWKNGKGDIVKEVSDACREAGLKFGVYLSPWDRHEPTYGTNQYNDYYKNQLRELLTNYGEVSEVWFDGAKGENAKDMKYDFQGYWNIVRQLQPNAVLFSDIGPDVRWVGNEKGFAGETCWSTITTDGMDIGKADEKYLNTGDANGKSWITPECDVSIRKGWFYHESENTTVRTPQNLVDLYYKSVGRNGLLLLNIPPNRRGLFDDTDINAIKEMRSILNETFEKNLAKGKAIYSLTDNKLNTVITLQPNQIWELNFKQPVQFDRVLLQENIAKGQLIESLTIQYWDGTTWQNLCNATTVGYKKLIKTNLVETSKVRMKIHRAKGIVNLAEIGFFKASARE
ncbi:MAG: alpha-L-fucosidase [Arcicella sp.]|nr:alpha-L-fucosidase [Arcicella sp.]